MTAPPSRSNWRMPAAPLRKAAGISREQYLADMSDERFDAWCKHRVASASFDPELEQAIRQEVEEDRAIRSQVRTRDAFLNLGLGQPAFDGCESPLESRMLEAFFSTGAFQPLPAAAGQLVGWSPVWGGLFSQLGVRAANQQFCRVDFAVVTASRGSFIAVEVDGNHHLARAQVKKDRIRARNLVARGWTILNFGGDQVWREPEACVREVLDAVAWRLRRMRRGP
jgi:very-short-patch-repair endonuclease